MFVIGSCAVSAFGLSLHEAADCARAFLYFTSGRSEPGNGRLRAILTRSQQTSQAATACRIPTATSFRAFGEVAEIRSASRAAATIKQMDCNFLA